MKARRIFFSVVFAALFSSFFFFVYNTSVGQQERVLKNYLKIAAVSIDPKQSLVVRKAILAGKDRQQISTLPEYQYLKSVLVSLKETIPAGVKWTYLMCPVTAPEVMSMAAVYGHPEVLTSGRDYTVLSVLTVPLDPKQDSSLPGYLYEMTGYPDLIKAIRGPEQTVISQIVYDRQYQNWTRSGFVKVYDDTGRPEAVLGVDITIETEVLQAANALVSAALYSTVLTLFLAVLHRRRKSYADYLHGLGKSAGMVAEKDEAP